MRISEEASSLAKAEGYNMLKRKDNKKLYLGNMKKEKERIIGKREEGPRNQDEEDTLSMPLQREP